VSYSGDQNYLASSSTAVSETIFTTPDFQITASNPSPTVLAGLSANYRLICSLRVLPVRLRSPVTDYRALPRFSPSSLALGTGNFSAMLTISTTASSVGALKPVHPHRNPEIHLLPGCFQVLPAYSFASEAGGSRWPGRFSL
jgi:hypothetical protein